MDQDLTAQNSNTSTGQGVRWNQVGVEGNQLPPSQVEQPPSEETAETLARRLLCSKVDRLVRSEYWPLIQGLIVESMNLETKNLVYASGQENLYRGQGKVTALQELNNLIISLSNEGKELRENENVEDGGVLK